MVLDPSLAQLYLSTVNKDSIRNKQGVFMPRGSKSKYTSKQKRQAKHIEDSEKKWAEAVKHQLVLRGQQLIKKLVAPEKLCTAQLHQKKVAIKALDTLLTLTHNARQLAHI